MANKADGSARTTEVSEPEGAPQNKYSISDPRREISAASAESLPCLHSLQEGLWQDWHEALWATVRKYNINASIIRAIKNLYDKAQSAVLFNGSTGEWFRTTVVVRQGCLLSPTLFNIFLEGIMCEALDDHDGSVSIGGRLITNPLCRWHCRKCRRWRSWRPGRPFRYNHHKVQNGDRPRQDKSDDKQPKWLPKRDQDKSQRLEEVENYKYIGAII